MSINFRFFVISGCLMAQILANQRTLTLASCCQFYYKRVHRILPACLVMILVTFGVGQWMLMDVDFEHLWRDAIWAMIFTFNIKLGLEAGDGYFREVKPYKIIYI